MHEWTTTLGANFTHIPCERLLHFCCQLLPRHAPRGEPCLSIPVMYAKFRSTTLNEIFPHPPPPFLALLCHGNPLVYSQQDFVWRYWKPINQWHTLRPLTAPTEEKVQGHNPTWCRHKYANHVIHNAWLKAGKRGGRVCCGRRNCFQATKR